MPGWYQRLTTHFQKGMPTEPILKALGKVLHYTGKVFWILT